jgi:epoxyqueuosine reductase
MNELNRTVLDYVKSLGACAAGIATTKTLKGGPPSSDLTYVLPEAKSAVVFALPLDQTLILPFLQKKDRLSHERNNVASNVMASGIALELSNFLSQRGHPAAPVASNQVYRKESPRGLLDLMPNVSLRYLAVRSGIGWFGLSGNVITKDRGAGIILGAAVTEAELDPTDPLPPQENYCDQCRLCIASCMSRLMDDKERTEISLGGMVFSYSRRRTYRRCEYVCGGFTGLHPSGKWSNWSPGRFPIPAEDKDFMPALIKAVKASWKWPRMEGGFYHVVMKDKLYLTCGNCQLICTPDKEERKRRFKMLAESGVVMQNPDGTLEALPPEKARDRIASLPPDIRALYEDTGSP